MRVKTILQEFVGKKLAMNGLRVTKINAVLDMAEALIKGAHLTLTSLGDFMGGSAKPKNKIKRVDRFLDNEKLYSYLPTGYGIIFEDFLRARKDLDIIIDWSGCCNWDECCIRAALVCDGRAITIYQEVHETKKQQKPEIHKSFLQNLRGIIPKECNVTLITDRGFQTKWFQLVRDIGWDFIGRANQSYCYQLKGTETWDSIKALYDSANSMPELLGEGVLSRTCKVPAYFHSFKSIPKKRKHKKTKNKPDYPALVKSYKAQYKSPWIIVTSHSPESRDSKKIINNYHTRMQIEETFRDDKSERFGYGFRFGRTHSVKRLSILLFIAAISSFLLMIIGAAAENKKIHRGYQSNSIKTRRVLSLLTLAKRVLRHCIDKISRAEFVEGMHRLARGAHLCLT